MPDNNLQNNKIASNDDPLDINELALLNDDISSEFIEQLQSQIEQSAKAFNPSNSNSDNDDVDLFEEVQEPKKEEVVDRQETSPATINDSVDDNFIKKYKAKLNKQQNQSAEATVDDKPKAKKSVDEPDEFEGIVPSLSGVKTESQKSADKQTNTLNKANDEIENITNGNITEKPAQQEQINYNQSLDYIDNNVKYEKYVIYIDPENKAFIESLTVKERKNLINRILREQDNITVTKKRLVLIQTMMRHIIIAILTLSISIPVIYWTINSSLEVSINNYRKSQSLFQTLYKEKGKIKSKIPY